MKNGCPGLGKIGSGDFQGVCPYHGGGEVASFGIVPLAHTSADDIVKDMDFRCGN